MTEQGATVDVVMTEAATHFITPVTMQALSGRPVFVDAWDARVPNNMAHIDLTRGADAVLIAPASADFMAKLAHGMADDLLSTLCLARACPLLVAPAMNREMWANPATQRNVEQLRADGIAVLGPAAGEQACGETGDGRMLEAHELLTDLIAFFQPKLLAGRHVLLTAGPTSEPVDPIRVLSNRSSGKTGYALARAARSRRPRHPGHGRHRAARAARRHLAVRDHGAADARCRHGQRHGCRHLHRRGRRGRLAREERQRAETQEDQRRRRRAADGVRTQSGHPRRSGQAARRPWCVGFAAETEKLAEHAEAKRVRKGIPLLVGNLAQKVMDADTTELVLFDAQGVHPCPQPASWTPRGA